MTNHATNPAMPTPKAVPWTPNTPAVPMPNPAPQPVAAAAQQHMPQYAPQAPAQNVQPASPQAYVPQQQAPAQQLPQQAYQAPVAQPQYAPAQQAHMPQAQALAPTQQMMPPMPPQQQPHQNLMGQAGYSLQQQSGQVQPAQHESNVEAPKTKSSLLSRFQKPKQEGSATEAVQAKSAPKTASESLINASFLKGLAAGVIIAFAGSTLLGKLMSKPEAATRVATAPTLAPMSTTAAPIAVDGTTFIDEAVGTQNP